MSKAKVFDLTTTQLKRRLEREAAAGDEQPQQHSITADMSDGIDAIHQCLNLAGFDEGPRAFIFLLADAAGSLSMEHVELFDEDLAEAQNCSTRTVRRQRAAYMVEARRCRFTPVEVNEGDLDRDRQRHLPTRYKFHLTEFIEETVRQARASSQWHETDRRKQREAIKLAAEDNYLMIPDAPLKRRKQKRTRSAVAEMKTRLKVIQTNLEKLEEIAVKLSAGQYEELLDEEEGEGFFDRCAWMRAKIEALENLPFRQVSESQQVNRGLGHFVLTPLAEEMPAESDVEPEADPEAAATWERLEERLTTPTVRSVEIELHGPEGPPKQAGELPEELEEELTLEEERAAIMQYDGGLRREEAESLARGEVVNRRDDRVNRRGGGDSKPAAARDGPSG